MTTNVNERNNVAIKRRNDRLITYIDIHKQWHYCFL